MSASPEPSILEQARGVASFLNDRLPEALRKPKFAIICGSGLGGLVDSVDPATKVEIDYKDVPYFPTSTVQGHAGKLVFGYLGTDTPGVLMVGRTHYYEGYSMAKVTLPVRVFSLLGVEILIATNACGGLNSAFSVGDLMIINDHIFLSGLAGNSPLRGINIDEFGPRFPPTSDAYDLELRRTVHQVWRKMTSPGRTRRLQEGVYAFGGGPSYESRAECRFLRQLGADVAGMSTVPETIIVRHSGLRVLALSLVTNMCVSAPPTRGDEPRIQKMDRKELEDMLNEGKADHEEVIEAGKEAAGDMQELVKNTVKSIFAKEEENAGKMN
ncbi:hypothetical protein KEM56_002113 [Ascosphaera pollenicola]|nr:hypothetical protein KEM56_002113 [Ascosphaera pollenicola]